MSSYAIFHRGHMSGGGGGGGDVLHSMRTREMQKILSLLFLRGGGEGHL